MSDFGCWETGLNFRLSPNPKSDIRNPKSPSVHHCLNALEFFQVVLDFLTVICTRAAVQIGCQILRGGIELPELQTQQSAIAELLEVFGIRHQHHVHDRKTLIERLSLEIDQFQIV